MDARPFFSIQGDAMKHMLEMTDRVQAEEERIHEKSVSSREKSVSSRGGWCCVSFFNTRVTSK